MRLTPLDLQNHRFSHRLRGYDASEVDGFVRMVAEDLPAMAGKEAGSIIRTAEEKAAEGEAGATLRKVKLADRLKVLELIGRHVGVGAWRDKVDVNVTSTLAERLARARARGG